MIWKDVLSEGQIDHRGDTVIVGGAAPNLMVNLTLSARGGRSTRFIIGGPYPTLQEARLRAEAMAAEHGIGVIYRVMPPGSPRSSTDDGAA